MNALVPVSAHQALSIPDVERVAMAIAKGGLFGSKDPNAVLTLCLLAQAEGQHPAVVFRDYHIISGKPAKKAEAMLRDFLSSGGKVEWHALTDTVADATFSHPGGGTVRIDWTLERARTAGIANPMWKKYPRQMLRSRVISEGVRSVCPSATSGLYEVGEVQDIAAENRVPVSEAPGGGVIEGQFEERTVSPNDAATDTLRGQLEQSVAQETDKTKGWREPDSIYSTPSKLHAAVARLERELHGCGDMETLYCLLLTEEWLEFVRIAKLHAPHYLDGGEPAPEEFVGLRTKAQRLYDEFQIAAATGMVDLVRAG